MLNKHGVDYIIIGGQAEYLMGSPRVTVDVDLCYDRAKTNLEKLAEALKDLKPTLRDAPKDLPIIIDARALSLGSNYTFDTTAGQLDLLGWVEPIGDFAKIADNAEQFQVGDFTVRTIGLADLIKVKEHIGRSKDREALYQLLAIKRLREESR